MLGLSDDDKPRFLGRRIAPGLKLVALAIISIVLMMVDNAHDSLSTVRGALAVALEPVQMAAEMPGDAANYLKNYFDRGNLIQENEQLSQKVLLLQGRLQQLAALQAENERIRALLASASSINQNVLIARILAVSPDPYRQYVKLNKGSSDGVFVGQALIDAHGIMGQVTNVTPLDSRAILISDPNNGIPVEVNRTGLQTIAQGTGRSNALTLPFLPNNADIKVGDLLVSSGLGGRYPPNYPVARVTKVVHRPGEEFLDVTAKPTADLDRGREALLVWNSNSNDDPPAPDNAGKSGQPPAAAKDDASGASDNKAAQ
ncbi:rod shape-determining protein MreC [Salinisphaera hydrothermalis]|uniref:Cell shape-determining protein MreC n=1 Tax=Salinisphaera hydrothermalis (strain C41B8) TaxID=1304275 RepID=A0A084IL24_SALHC|nr:rod shape-determining protein MreC [Salinisphaera hydrothermalis]KEZ77408.1 rod shape-determining protein MreC [Salinisphaera hydrothermalis C41B8]